MHTKKGLPMVSCICPTFGRPTKRMWLLNECVESFNRQTYKNKELIILNDCRGQDLHCKYKNIRIVNLSVRLSSVGAKRNALVDLAIGDLIAPWDDDDISLPHRLELSVDRLMTANADYFNPKSYWFMVLNQKLQYEQMTGYAHNCSLFTKNAWTKVGGYPNHCRDDAEMDRELSTHCKVEKGPLSAEEGVYIYRWGVSNHLSGNPDMDLAYKERGNLTYEQGLFEIVPMWFMDYTKIIREACEKMKDNSSTKRSN